MGFRRGLILTLSVAGLALASAGVADAAAVARSAPGPMRHLTWADLSTMSEAQVARLQNPLIAAVTPVSRLGATARWSGLFSHLSLDTPRHLVDLYVTDPARAAGLLVAAKKADPSLNLRLFRVRLAPLSAAQVNRASSRLLTASIKGTLPFRVFAVSHPGNGPSLQVFVAHPNADRRLSARRLARLGGRSVAGLAGVRLVFVHGAPMAPLSRGDDSAPFIGGDDITDLTYACTAGIALEKKSTGEDYVLTASHCFSDGEDIYNGNGTHTVGVVTSADKPHDAEIIDTGAANGNGSNADEGEYNKGSDGIQYYALVDTVGVADHEIAYQDGYSTFLWTGGVAKDYVISTSYDYSLTTSWGTYEVYGDEVEPYTSGTCNDSSQAGCAAISGDSGAVVFTYRTSSTRNAMGVVSYGPSCTSQEGWLFCTRMAFTPINPILTNTGLILNPHT
jgi:hypothetical protein